MPRSFQSLSPGAHLSDRVAEALSAEIGSGGIALGDKLPTEAALAEQFGGSTTVVREAVQRLKSLPILKFRNPP